MSDSILPLKIVDFEHYMLADDEPDYPMVIGVRLNFDGLFDRPRLEQSFFQTVEDNPLLRAILEDQQGEFFWVETDLRPKFEWTDSLPVMVRLNLFDEPGVHILAKEENGQTFIRLFVHHSVSDGAGIVHLVDQWLTHYQDLASSESDSKAGNALRRNADLADRGRFGMSFWKYLLRPFQEFCGLIGITEYFSHRPVAIGPQQSELSADPSEPLSHQQTILEFTKEETSKVVKDSKATKNKINDMMVASIFDACQIWLNQNQPEEAHRHIRVVIPMDMRNKKAPESYVANVVSMTYLDRRPGRYKSISSICRYAWLEMTAIKLMKLGLTFIHMIRYFRRRGKLKKLLRRDRSVASTTYSNMGRVFTQSKLANEDKVISVEGVKLQGFHVFPPIRPYTWITAVVVTYANRFAVNFTWCSKSLSQDDVNGILTQFKHNLLTSFSNSTTENKTEKNPAESK